MGQMADKRTNQAEFDALFFLGLACYRIAERGEAAFGDEEQRRHLAGCLCKGFPADQFPAWAAMSSRDKPLFEAEAALWVLREVIDRQCRRRIQSGVIEEDLAPYVRKLYQQALRKALPSKEGLTAGPKAPRRRPPDPEQSLPDSPEEAAVWPYYREGLFREDDDDFTSEVLESVSGESASEDDDHSEEALERLTEGLNSFLTDPANWDLSKAEHRAVVAVIDACSQRAPWHSRTDTPALASLPEAQQRAFRRACKRFPCLRSHILSIECKEEPCIRPQLKWACEALSIIRQEVAQGEAAHREPRRYRRGRVFLKMAEEQERAGFPKLAAGLRASDKFARGVPLSEGEIALAKAAQKWGREDWKPRVLRGNPLALLMEPVFRDGSAAAAGIFALECLALALVCWPEGGRPRAALPPSPPSTG